VNDTHCALSACFEMIVVSPDGQELAKSESRALRRRRRVASSALAMQPAKATRPSTRQVRVSAHYFPSIEPFDIIGGIEIEKSIIRQPPIGGKDDYDSENSWISDGLP